MGKLGDLINNVNNNGKNNNNKKEACLCGDSFNVEDWITSSNQQMDNKLAAEILPSRGAAMKAKKEKDPRSTINDNRIFYDEYTQSFKCIQLFNMAHLDVMALNQINGGQ